MNTKTNKKKKQVKKPQVLEIHIYVHNVPQFPQYTPNTVPNPITNPPYYVTC